MILMSFNVATISVMDEYEIPHERSAQRVYYDFVLLSVRVLGFGVTASVIWGWLASTVVSMACQSQNGIYWLDLADTILVNFGDMCSGYGVLFLGWGRFSSSQLAGLSS